MAKEKQTQISVITVFDGTQDVQQAFIDLIIKKRRDKINLDSGSVVDYNSGKVFSDVRVEREEKSV